MWDQWSKLGKATILGIYFSQPQLNLNSSKLHNDKVISWTTNATRAARPKPPISPTPLKLLINLQTTQKADTNLWAYINPTRWKMKRVKKVASSVIDWKNTGQASTRSMKARFRLHGKQNKVWCHITFRYPKRVELQASTDTLVCQLPYHIIWGWDEELPEEL